MIFGLQKELQAFQQNAYDIKKLLKWEKFKFVNIKNILIGVAILAPVDMVIRSFLIITLIALYITFNKKVVTKKPLVYTVRVKRLILTICILTVASYAAMFVNELHLYVALNIIFSFIFIIFANILNAPIEFAIRKYYKNDAKKKISKMKNLKVIGITGSYGKTSTKHIIGHILSEKFYTLITPGSYNTEMGVVITIRNMLKPIHEVFVVEMGAYVKGEIKVTAELVKPSIGVLTSIGPQHLDTFKTIENIKNTKYELIEALTKDSIAFFNEDNENVKEVSSRRKDNKEYYSTNDISKVAYTKNGTEFKYKETLFKTKLLGKLNLLNVVAGIKVAESLGMTLKEIRNAVYTLEPVQHRLNLLNRGKIKVIDDSFNSNPEGSKMALEVLRDIEGNKKILVTPGMIGLGKKQYEYNKLFGEFAAECCDYIYLVGAKQTKAIVDGLKEKSYTKFKVVQTLDEANKNLNSIVSEGDVVLYENDLPDAFNE